MTFASRLYVGSVNHRRLRPVAHHLRYRMFWLLLDLDEVDSLARNLRWFSHNRFNLVSFFDRDHGAGDSASLSDYVDGALRKAGISTDGGPIRLLCMPRILGYGFNPLSVFFCYRRDGQLAAILYEVHNTLGERHGYLIPVEDDRETPLRHSAEKRFYVSPFMDMDMTYDFRMTLPADRVSVAIKGSDSNGSLIAAALYATQRTLTDSALLRLLATHPLLTLKVISAIHWHAIRIWRKGVAIRPWRKTKSAPITVGRATGRTVP